ncbi:MAG: hypothetical protein UV09_C0002G0014 [Candidatus Gottesmanbacteria bacterium GW2011_GWA2_42_18]|uniref:Uncharacterized protein n=1 Tax=Candidatus Gottesmanbacteria bacterium GW2011_GWA2_42_18 TaxID=1618442 RepID=A0A0G1BNJ2_9BACT|nr:MAG: hypothetical protein UV09_C0002G0014 [Candidatus Gottesmanbacteria bacterium GW2011_GWA2_42_18]
MPRKDPEGKSIKEERKREKRYIPPKYRRQERQKKITKRDQEEKETEK